MKKALPVRPRHGTLTPRSLWRRAAIVAAGIMVLQGVLYTSSLSGRTILLPIDLLASRSFYLPPTAQYRSVRPLNLLLADQVLQYEPMRRFAAAEFRAGRVPLWTPYEYCGAPFAGWAKYSLFNIIYYCFPTPYSLVWIQVAKSLLAGAGAYLCLRKVLGVGFWPAAVGAWCYPITGYFALWQGYPLSYTTAWYPWLILATDRVIRRPVSAWSPGLAVLTALVVTSGAIDIAGQALLASGLFAVWRFVQRYRRRHWQGSIQTGITLIAAWSLGFMLAAPFLLPMTEYLLTGARMRQRAQGSEERPPIGLTILPQVVLPLTYGSSLSNSVYLGEKVVFPESAAAAYAGLLATVVLAPLSWYRRRLRGLSLFWLLQGLLGLAWLLNLPGVVSLLRAPGLNMFSSNRFTFITGFALVALAVSGLESVRRGVPAHRYWYALPALLLLLLAGWCAIRATESPEQWETRLRQLGRIAGQPAEVASTHQNFVDYHKYGLGLCVVGVAVWALCWFGLRPRPWLVPLAGCVWAAELLGFAAGLNPQCDPALYYPPIPALEKLAARPPGRILAIRCMPPLLNEIYGLREVCGYDAVDPARLIELLDRVKDPRYPTSEYAATQNYVPILPRRLSGEVYLPPVLSMLNVRYIVSSIPLRGMKPIISQDHYWVWENEAVLPRAFVPARVRPAPNKEILLRLIGGPDFNPRQVAYLDDPPPLPDSCRGTATIVAEVPTHITLELDMETPGLMVLSDLWYEGWHAKLNGQPVPVLRVNHALRGVVVPAGRGTLEFDYRPASFVTGLWLSLSSLIVVLLWLGLPWGIARRAGVKARSLGDRAREQTRPDRSSGFRGVRDGKTPHG